MKIAIFKSKIKLETVAFNIETNTNTKRVTTQDQTSCRMDLSSTINVDLLIANDAAQNLFGCQSSNTLSEFVCSIENMTVRVEIIGYKQQTLSWNFLGLSRYKTRDSRHKTNTDTVTFKTKTLKYCLLTASKARQCHVLITGYRYVIMPRP